MSLDKATGERGLWYYDEEKKCLSIHKPEKKRVNVTVITDDIHSGMLAPFNQKFYHSKSRMRADAKALGCVELGNDKIDQEKAEREREKQSARDTHEALIAAAKQHGYL